jgi:hypothetical protein
MTSTPTTKQIEALNRLRSVVEARNGADVESALNLAWRAGLHPNLCTVLIDLAEAPWHMRHEDVVFAIQQLRCASAVPSLERTAHASYEYLSYDEFFGLARKCTWALADIGTSDAYHALERLMNSSHPLVSEYARKRLARWHNEQHRKAKPQSDSN